MIRNYQKTSGDSNVDLSPIYNSLQTINALLYRLDVQTTIPSAINSISNSVVNIENRIDNITKDDYSLAYYITESVLSKPLWQYNNYSTFQSTAPIVIYEPYVQSITNYEHLEGRYYFAYNLPNATLNYIVGLPPRKAIEYQGLTVDAMSLHAFIGTSCVINTMYVTRATFTNCSLQSLSAKTATISNCDINTLNIENGGDIYNCFLKNNTINGCNIYSCLGYNVNGNSNNFVSCTLANYPTASNTFREMNLNNVNQLSNVKAMTCKLECANKNTNNSFDNCTFDDVSIYHLTHTNFINQCSGNVFIPRLINGSNMFDDNNNYIGELNTSMSYNTSSTYTVNTEVSWEYEQTEYPEYSSTYTVQNPYVEESTSYRTIDTSYVYTFTLPEDPTNTINQTNYTTTYDTYAFETTDILTVTANPETPESYTHTMASIYDVTTTHIDDYTYDTYSVSTNTDYWTETITKTYTLNTITETILVSDYTSLSTYEPLLTVNILPEWRTPNIFTNNSISSKYMNTYVNLNNYTISSPGFTLNNCTGNAEMYISSITTNYIIANNDLYKFKLNVNNLNGPFIFSANIIKDGDILIDSFSNPTIAFSVNSFDKLNLYYNYTQNQSMVLEKNEFNVLNIQAGAKGNIRMSSCTINNGVLYGWNGLYYCTANYIENYGENSYSKNSINTLRAHDIKFMYDNTITKLIIEPNDYEGFSFMGNNIATIICPSYFNISASAIYNTFGTIIAY